MRLRRWVLLVPLLLLALASSAPVAASDSASAGGWRWPIADFTIIEMFEAPAHEYGPGHRGVDLLPGARTSPVVATADGIIAFRGRVGDRDLVTIDHGDGLITTLEPVASSLAAGTHVVRGDPIGKLSVGGHAAPGTLHVGVRLHGSYINPMVLTGSVPRAVLLPCC